MLEYTEKIQQTAGKLLKDKTVDVFIGYKKGTVPMINEPVLIRDPDKVDILYWDSFCGLNLCNYLTKREDKIGIVATGCNSRNMVTHIVENQIKREQLHIVGIPCTGMIDHRAVERAVGHKEIIDIKEDGDGFTVRGRDFEETLKKKEYLQTNCAICRHRNPVIKDEMIAEPVKEQAEVEAYKDVEKVEDMASEQRWKWTPQTTFDSIPISQLIFIITVNTILAIFVVFLYAVLYKGIPGRGIKKGIIFGLLMYPMSVLVPMFSMYVLLNIATGAILYFSLQGLVEFLVYGAIIAVIYKEK